MITRLAFVALLVASLAYLFSGDAREQYVRGKGKTVLFITNSEHGLVNVHLATASALLERYPDLDIHYASFPSVRPRLERISSSTRDTPSSITFHEIKNLTFAEAIVRETRDFIAPPASAGIGPLTDSIQLWVSPWSVEEHMTIFNQLGGLIDELDPAVVVLDSWLRPAIDATRDRNRQHAFITPNTLLDNFLGNQRPWSIWKYPATGSGFAFPVPLRNIAENVYLNARFIYAAMLTPALSAKKAALKEQGLGDPVNYFGIHRPDAPWITQTTEGAAIPLDVVPPNVTCAGPIILSGASAAQQDPELAAWLEQAPTVLVNLGSNLAYDEPRAAAMSIAIADLLAKTDVQVLWKFNKLGEYPDDVLSELRPYLSNRLRMSNWLTADPYSLLETGNIVASVHHGGSGCYHEAIAAGVPQVVLPLWADLYNFAALVETVGVGVWGCGDSSPVWTGECLSSAFFRVLDGREGVSLQRKAKQLGETVRAGEKGRDIAARVIAGLVYGM